jgi:hypothetical protein
MTIRRAIGATALCTVVGTLLGTALGRGLGYFAPGYYRSVFYRGNEPSFDPVDVGTGLGLNAGVFTGLVVGLLIVAVVTYYEIRRADTNSRESVSRGTIPGFEEPEALALGTEQRSLSESVEVRKPLP